MARDISFAYTDASDWTAHDCSAFMGFLSHAFYKAPRRADYAQTVRSLHFASMGQAQRAMAGAVLDDVPQGWDFLSPASREAILATPALDPPLVACEDGWTRHLERWGVVW